MEIIFELQEVEARDRALRNIRLPHWCSKNTLLRPALPSSDEIIHDLLGFSENSEVRAAIDIRRRGDIWAADHDRPSPRAAQLDNAKNIGLLEQHSPRHHQVGPFEVGFGQGFGIAIDE